MGDHTDYNGGFVLPAAIPQTTRVEVAPSGNRTVRVWSSLHPDTPPVGYELGREVAEDRWTDYVKGMSRVLAEWGLRSAFDARIVSDVPVGGGLSSSAALEIALGRALREAFALSVSDVELAKAGRRAENDFVGAPVGIMDQMACSLASASVAIFLDTRSLAFEHVRLPAAAGLIVINSGIAHRHAGGEYARRRRECEEAARLLGVRELRDTDEAAVARAAPPAPLGRRARHVASENRRVLDMVAALRAAELTRAGELLAESHASLRDDFEVSVPDIDALVEIASGIEGVYGARLTGGGFGGSIVAIARAEKTRHVADQMLQLYMKHTGRAGSVVVPAGQHSET
jgi:galactokinase